MRLEQAAPDGQRLVEPRHRRGGIAGREIRVAEQRQRRRAAAQHLLVVRRRLEERRNRRLDPLQDGAEILEPHALDVADALGDIAGDVVDGIPGDRQVRVGAVGLGIGSNRLGVGPTASALARSASTVALARPETPGRRRRSRSARRRRGSRRRSASVAGPAAPHRARSRPGGAWRPRAPGAAPRPAAVARRRRGPKPR